MLSQELSKSCMNAKQLYAQFMNRVIMDVESVQSKKKKERVGILPFVTEYSLLVEDSLCATSGCTNTSDFESNYERHLRAIISQVERIAPDSKYPAVVQFGLALLQFNSCNSLIVRTCSSL
eukprot:m.219110 g.219110  ORF g.219110 m.219110 type:complete len:121 (-) comp13821_c0_seq16:3398-3760(-)